MSLYRATLSALRYFNSGTGRIQLPTEGRPCNRSPPPQHFILPTVYRTTGLFAGAWNKSAPSSFLLITREVDGAVWFQSSGPTLSAGPSRRSLRALEAAGFLILQGHLPDNEMPLLARCGKR